MKIRFIYLFLTILVISIWSCKNENSSADGIETPNDVVSTVKSADPDVMEARDRAKEKLVGVTKEGIYDKLISNYWIYETVVKGIGTTEEFVGYWMKFSDDQTYIQGKYGKNLSSGKWNYKSSNEILTMLPDDASKMPFEYKLMSKGKTIICVGTGDFKNNDTQMKWSGGESKPTAPPANPEEI